MSSQVRACACGRVANHPRVGLCHACYQRAYRQRRVNAGTPLRQTGDWFDHEVVQRAWFKWMGVAAPEPGRRLTNVERLYLCYVAVSCGFASATSIRELIRTPYDVADRLVRDITSGRVTVYKRDNLGRPTEPLPVP